MKRFRSGDFKCNSRRRVKFCLTDLRTATLLRLTRHEASSSSGCIKIQIWNRRATLCSTGHSLEHVICNGASDLDESTAFTVVTDAEDTQYARLSDCRGRFLRVNSDSMLVSFTSTPPDNDMAAKWRLKCVAETAPRHMVGANLIENARHPGMYLAVTRS